MPDITNGREKVNAFLKDKGIKKTTLAVAYGFKRQEVTNILRQKVHEQIALFFRLLKIMGLSSTKKAPNRSQALIKITN